MPRPQKCRRICHEPQFQEFVPIHNPTQYIQLTTDEYEVIRLVDYENKTHMECAKLMDISRTTVTEIYDKARFKIASCLVNGQGLRIQGGHYRLCDGSAYPYCKKKCKYSTQDLQSMKKGGNQMRIAVTYEDGYVFQHFGHCEQFKIYDIENKSIVSSKVIQTNGSGHGALAGFLSQNQVDILICGGIGAGAQNALMNMGITLYGGITGLTDQVVEDYLNNTLPQHTDVQCHHHDHDDHHNCGEHGCGQHHCG